MELYVIPPSIGNPYKWVYKPHGFDDHLPSPVVSWGTYQTTYHHCLPNEAIKPQFETSKHGKWTTILKRAFTVYSYNMILYWLLQNSFEKMIGNEPVKSIKKQSAAFSFMFFPASSCLRHISLAGYYVFKYRQKNTTKHHPPPQKKNTYISSPFETALLTSDLQFWSLQVESP